MNKLNLARFVLNSIITIGVGKIVSDVIENNTTPKGSTTDKVERKLGRYAIGGLVAHETVKFTNRKIDETISDWKRAQEKAKADLTS